MDKTIISLVEGMERLGLIAHRIRKNEGQTPQIEIDIILQELRNLYMVALQLESKEVKDVVEFGMDLSDEAECMEPAEEKRQAEEAAARKAADEKRQAEEAAARKAAEEKARRIVDEEFRPKFAPATQEPEAEHVKGSQMERI